MTSISTGRPLERREYSGESHMALTRTLVMTRGSNGAPLFASLGTAESTAAAIKALESAETWGQFLHALPPHLADQVREGFDEGELPDAADDFDPSDVPGVENGDFPAWINSTMLRELPKQVIERFGNTADSALNGPSVEFDAKDLPAIVAALHELGFTVSERPDLVLTMESDGHDAIGCPEPPACEALTTMATSAERAQRAIAAGSPECPVDCLERLILEFPSQVLANAALHVCVAADPRLLTSWRPTSLAILATSCERELAEVALRGAATDPGPRDWLPGFLTWWRGRGRPPFDPHAHSVALHPADCALPLQTEQQLRALAHLAAVSGYQEVTLLQWHNRSTDSAGSETTGILADSGAEEDELDACWRALMSTTIDDFDKGDRSERWLKIRQRDAIEIGVEDSSQLGFEVLLESADSPAVFVNDLSDVAPRAPVCRDGVVSAWERASAIAQTVAQEGILVWACSRVVDIDGLFEAAEGDGPVIASLHASPCGEFSDDCDEADAHASVARIVAQSVHDASPDLMSEYLESVEIEQIHDPESAAAMAQLAKEILIHAFGEPSEAIGHVSVGESADIAMIFINGHLERIFGFGALQVTYRAECRIELDKVTPRTPK